MPKKRAKKAAEPEKTTVECSYSKRIGDAPAMPTPTAETHGPVVETKTKKRGGKKALQPA